MWIRRLKYWWQRDQRRAALRDEMETHLAERATLLPSYVPAWKASRIDPMTAVRHE
jgi:hypothetical protein